LPLDGMPARWSRTHISAKILVNEKRGAAHQESRVSQKCTTSLSVGDDIWWRVMSCLPPWPQSTVEDMSCPRSTASMEAAANYARSGQLPAARRLLEALMREASKTVRCAIKADSFALLSMKPRMWSTSVRTPSRSHAASTSRMRVPLENVSSTRPHEATSWERDVGGCDGAHTKWSRKVAAIREYGQYRQHSPASDRRS